jgi:hypothetical protein
MHLFLLTFFPMGAQQPLTPRVRRCGSIKTNALLSRREIALSLQESPACLFRLTRRALSAASAGKG